AAANAPKQEQLQMIEKLHNAVEIAKKQLQAAQQEDEVFTAVKHIDQEMRNYSNRQTNLFVRFRKKLLTKAFSKNPNAALHRVLEIKKNFVPDVNGKVVVNAFQWAKARLAISSPNALVEVQRLEADSKFFRSLLVILLALTGWLLWRAFRGNPN